MVRTEATPGRLFALASMGEHTSWLYDAADDPAVILQTSNFFAPVWRRVKAFDRITVLCRPGQKPDDYKGSPGMFELLIVEVVEPFPVGPRKAMTEPVVRTVPYFGFYPPTLLSAPAEPQAEPELETAA